MSVRDAVWMGFQNIATAMGAEWVRYNELVMALCFNTLLSEEGQVVRDDREEAARLAVVMALDLQDDEGESPEGVELYITDEALNEKISACVSIGREKRKNNLRRFCESDRKRVCPVWQQVDCCHDPSSILPVRGTACCNASVIPPRLSLSSTNPRLCGSSAM